MKKGIQVEENSRRLDIYLSEKFKDYSRSFLQKLIKNGFVKVNSNKVLKADLKLKAGDIVEIEFPEKKKIFDKLENFLEIVYEDDSILVINKPAGLCVHPAGKFSLEPTLVDFLGRQEKGLDRSGIVHRLDRDTSGIMVIAKTPQAQFSLMKQFQKRMVKKTYLGIVHGIFSYKEYEISAPIMRSDKDRKKFCIGPGRDAVTEFKVLKCFNNYSLLEIYPQTGRTHQIRVHLSSIGHPIVGDKLYGNKKDDAPRQMLHSYKLKLFHPEEKKQMEWKAKIPDDFLSVLKKLSVLFFVLCFTVVCTNAASNLTQVSSTSNSISAEIKNIKSELKNLIKEIEKIDKVSQRVSAVEESLKEQDTTQQNRIKEINMAVADLNRKITNLEIDFEEYKRTSKLEKIKQQDKESKNKTEIIEKPLTSEEPDKISILEAEISLVKKEIAIIREKIELSRPKSAEEESTEEDKLMKFLKSPWAVATALGISVLALIIAVF